MTHDVRSMKKIFQTNTLLWPSAPAAATGCRAVMWWHTHNHTHINIHHTRHSWYSSLFRESSLGFLFLKNRGILRPACPLCPAVSLPAGFLLAPSTPNWRLLQTTQGQVGNPQDTDCTLEITESERFIVDINQMNQVMQLEIIISKYNPKIGQLKAHLIDFFVGLLVAVEQQNTLNTRTI